MAQQGSSKPMILEVAPFLGGLLIAAHVIAVAYWIYRLASQKQLQKPPRSKAH